jgi:hypothetical protein
MHQQAPVLSPVPIQSLIRAVDLPCSPLQYPARNPAVATPSPFDATNMSAKQLPVGITLIVPQCATRAPPYLLVNLLEHLPDNNQGARQRCL